MLDDPPASPDDSLLLGIDVGSTTVKVVAVDPHDCNILWSDCQRHDTRQADKLLELLAAMHRALPHVPQERIRSFITGSGARPLSRPLGAQFVQEVNAVTLAVEKLHADAGSVIELGGQDAKIIVFKLNPETGEKLAVCSMNDKCASGTGATIDKCMKKLGLAEDELAELPFDNSRLHKVAAKCGVFAETDVVNLVKSGIPADEVMCSLADAIVNQNLSVLTRGNTLSPKVLLLGGPNTYLRFIQECWRVRIPETWIQRKLAWSRDVPLEQLIAVPDNSQYYAAWGAVIYGLEEPPHVGRYQGIRKLESFLRERADRRSGAETDPPLVTGPHEAAEFAREFSPPVFTPRRFSPGQRVRAAIGLDGGSTSSKAVLVDEAGDVIARAYRLSQGNPIRDMKELLADLESQVVGQSAKLEVLGLGVTGYAADVLEASIQADVNIVETVAHMQSARHFFGDVDVICDIGGQDIKVLFMQNGDIKDFRLSNQCSAGNGMMLQSMADQLGIPVEGYAELAFRAKLAPRFSFGCAVFLESDRVNFQKEGFSREELLAGLARVLPKNIWQYVVQVSGMAALGTRFVLQGGVQYNLAAVKAQVNYIRERVPHAGILVHPHCGEAGAIGAAIETLRIIRRRGYSKFIGIEQAVGLQYSTRNDEQTRCYFCPNQCSRTFIDTHPPGGSGSRYISGFSCEKGTVESRAALRKLLDARNELKQKYVNLVEYESRLAFGSIKRPEPLSEQGTAIDDVQVSRNWLGQIRRRPVRRGFCRSSEASRRRRGELRIGMPRVLNMYSTAPLFRTYFETLGIPPQNICFSPATSHKMFREGARYGSVDPCFPAKVVQAHLHHLLFHVHHPPDRPLDYIFFPAVTHLPTSLQGTMDAASCTIAAGTPSVMKADGAVTLGEHAYFKRQMFEMWGERLGITEDESDFAVDQGWESLDQFDAEIQRRGLEVLEQVEAENRLALLVLSRPYHADPGLHHGILEDFQALGYPILSIRSIPRDKGWLSRWFKDDLESGRIDDPLDIGDVWPENYSANSAHKVWAAKFAARHPHVAVLDLSSFKCGHDAPIYSLVDQIIENGQTPYMAIHDLDANKPFGSQKIRVKTYAYTLQRYQETLHDRARKMSELQRRIAARRRELLAERQMALAVSTGEAIGQNGSSQMAHAFRAYLQEEESVYGMSLHESSEQDSRSITEFGMEPEPVAGSCCKLHPPCDSPLLPILDDHQVAMER